MKKTNKEFILSSWAIDHKTVIYVIMTIFLILGIVAYVSMPRESFPEVNDTRVFVNTIFPGNSAEDIERLVTDPLEEELKSVQNLVDIKSTSSEDFSIIEIEFNEDITIDMAKQKTKDLADVVTSGADWPTFNDAKVEPSIFELDFSELVPILNVNLVGDYPIEQMKAFAESLEEKIEDLPQIKAVDIRGIQDFEVEVAVDIYKMMAAKVSFNDIMGSIRGENSTLSAGNIVLDGQRRNVRVLGEIKNPEELASFVVKAEKGNAVYLGDLATIRFKEKEKTSYARSFGEKAVMLDVKKRGGSNLIYAAQQIDQIVKDAIANDLPKDLEVTISNDQSNMTLNQVSDLVNNIIFGVLLVVTVLMFFLGFRNALFVGFAIPMSMFMSFMIMSALGYTMNTMILFGLVMGLGMLVDNGIVVVENVYRLMEKEGMSRVAAAKAGIGEIALPIIVSTATTIAAFIPLGAWPGLMGEFMIYFPITLSVVLGSSLIVAIFFNSMLVSQFMEIEEREITKKSLWRLTAFLGSLGFILIFNEGFLRALGTLMLLVPVLFWLYKLFIKKAAFHFQKVILVALEQKYQRFLSFALRGRNPYAFLGGTFMLLILSFMLMGVFPPKVEFFPDNQPNQIVTYIEYPEGTSIDKTNAITKRIESEIYAVIQQAKYKMEGYNFMVESGVAQVGEGAGNPITDAGNNEMPHKSKITITLREFKYRNGFSSEEMRMEVQKHLAGKFPGIAISVEKDQAGPPVGYPINIEISGRDYQQLIVTAQNMKDLLNRENIAGIEQLKIDVNKNKPGLEFEIDRKKAGELGVSASFVGQQLRTSLFGAKAGIYKKDGEDYEINVRFNEENRYNKNALFNQNVMFRDQSSGQIKEIPISALVTGKNTASFSAIKHRKLKRLVTLYSSVLPGYNANEVMINTKKALSEYDLPEGVAFKFTGEIEEQEENMSFLSKALAFALALILLLLVFQFNSISKPFIILLSIFLSFTGVFLGLMIFQMPFVILMTMMGIISLAGIVVNNGVVLLDYTQLLIDRKKEANAIDSESLLPKKYAIEAIVEGGTARLRPVILTAITTVLGLIPLAIGLNIDFFSLVSNWSPNIYVGGDNVMFWGPLAWTVIFGLTFATFLTLVIVPSTFLIIYNIKLWVKKTF